MGQPTLIADKDFDRRKFVGSSNVAAIMGMTPTINGERYTELDVWAAKRSAEEEQIMDPGQKLFLTRRKRWEGPVVEHLREELDAKVIATNRRWVDGDVPYFAAEIDFEWELDAASARAMDLPPDLVGTIQNGEIKTVSPRAYSGRYDWGDPGTEDIPIHYWLQVQFALSVTQRQVSVVAALVGLDDMVFYVIRRNDTDIPSIREKAQRFWVDHVLTGVAPEPQTLGDLDKLYPDSAPGLSVDGTTNVGSQALQLRAIYGQMEAFQLQADALEFDVKRAMGAHEKLTVDGKPIFSWKSQKWGRLDQDSLKLKHKEIHKEFYLTGTHRVFKRMARQ